LVLPGRGLGLFESTVPSRGGASLNFVDFGLEGKGRLLSLGSLFTVFEDFSPPQRRLDFLRGGPIGGFRGQPLYLPGVWVSCNPLDEL